MDSECLINLLYTEIKPTAALFDLKIREVMHYRYLLYLFVKRDFITNYKQTILGPVWHILQPLLTSLMFTAIFFYFARIKIGAVPPVAFYLSGLTLWNYFAACINKTSSTFVSNAGIFGKGIFPPDNSSSCNCNFKHDEPRYPIADVNCHNGYLSPSSFIAVDYFSYAGFYFAAGSSRHGFWYYYILFDHRYRDLIYLMNFGMQLWMYATPVIYPMSIIPEKYKVFLKLNPVTSIIEGFRYSLFGQRAFLWHDYIYTSLFYGSIDIGGPGTV